MRRLADYELIDRLGSGGMAEVWMGRRIAGEGVYKAVAIKVLPAQRVGDERYRRMFNEEARISFLLSHSNIVQVFDLGQSDGQAFLVMEWVDGVNLAQLAELTRSRRIAVPDGITAYVIGEVLQALAYAHTLTHEGRPLAIIHRDVSPQNVLISVSGEVKLADFGIARVAHDETSGLFVKGKLRYMAPEQLAGQSRSPAVDLFAVGAMLHELLDGARFRDGDDEAVLLAQVHRGDVPPLRRRNVPRELEELRQALLRPNPDERLASAELALEQLRRWPGYRSEALALGRLVRICVGVAAPRSGVTTAPLALAEREAIPDSGLAQAAALASHAPPRRFGALLVAAAAGGGIALASVGIWQNAAEPRAATVTRASVGGKGAAAHGGGDTSPRAGASEPPMSTGEPQAPAAPEPPATPEPVRPAPVLGTAPSPEGSGGQGAQARPRGDAPRRDRSPARVQLKSGSFLYVYVRLKQGADAQTLIVEPLREIELAAGRYEVEIRQEPTAPWRSIGEIRVRAGGSYEARMGENAVTLRELEAPAG